MLKKLSFDSFPKTCSRLLYTFSAISVSRIRPRQVEIYSQPPPPPPLHTTSRDK
jgi:hypothetical protein